ncbi:hypothetical protein L6452_38501 [Arctium lappa]|uniref:Uncharacterized protein n=1 Tax=Arctium lappa TaxID=4217 RepID=A0ACB8XQW8_ARCLA|nr:hypothetical protein L6452_38501 [Arctium lappa]
MSDTDRRVVGFSCPILVLLSEDPILLTIEGLFISLKCLAKWGEEVAVETMDTIEAIKGFQSKAMEGFNHWG